MGLPIIAGVIVGFLGVAGGAVGTGQNLAPNLFKTSSQRHKSPSSPELGSRQILGRSRTG